MEQEKSVDKQCHDVPLCAAGVADILESAADRFETYAAEGISFATEPDMGNTMRLTRAIGSDLPDVLRWLRFHGHAATADRLDKKLGEAAGFAADIDMAAKQAGGPRDSMLAINLMAVTGDIETELRQTAGFLREQVHEDKETVGDATQGSLEVPWDENDINYMRASVARIEFTEGKLSASQLSKNLGTIPVHYMKKRGIGCRVHIAEFRAWAESPERYPNQEVRAKIANNYIADVEGRKKSVRRTCDLQ